MKNLFFGLMAIFVFTLSSFTPEPAVVHSCKFEIWSTTTFKTVGYITVTDVPDNVSCDDKNLAAAVTAYVNQSTN